MKKSKLTDKQEFIMKRLARHARIAVDHCHCGHDHATLVDDRFYPVATQTVNSLERRGLIATHHFSGRLEILMLKK